MSEIRDLVDELKDRFESWRQRARSTAESEDLLEEPVVQDVEFVSLDPFASDAVSRPRAFADLTSAWIQQHCAPTLLAQGRNCYNHKSVCRVHAFGERMTGTVREQRYYDQEIVLRDGILLPSCTCMRGMPPPSLPYLQYEASRPRTALLPCKHVVAVLLAYVQIQAESAQVERLRNADPVLRQNTLVCPVTRQPLQRGQSLFRCRSCGICYSPAGWEFLRKTARGHCCGCNRKKTVEPFSPDR